MIEIRPEVAEDFDQIDWLLQKAFAGEDEAKLVMNMRQQIEGYFALVAEKDKKIIGHIAFSPVALQNQPKINIAGLAPMAVLPDYQRQGVGELLIKRGLTWCKQLNFQAVVVLGHPTYYPRFGFVSAARFNLKSEYSVPDEVFMVLELEPQSLNEKQGLIKYHKLFNEL